MTVLDANFILRAAVGPITTSDAQVYTVASIFFQRAAAGQERFTTTESVLAEVAFVLGKHYGVAQAEIIKRLRFVLTLPGCRIESKARCLAALDLWEAHPRLSFVDCLVAELAGAEGAPLATFDQALAKSAGVQVWPSQQ